MYEMADVETECFRFYVPPSPPPSPRKRAQGLIVFSARIG